MMQTIDGVKPPRPRRHRGQPQASVNRVSRRRGPIKARVVTIQTGPKATGLRITRPHARLKKTVMVGLLITIAILGITILARQPLGLVAVMGYGIFAFVRHISSRATFIVALVAITLVPATLLLFGGRNVVTSAFASYGFLLFAIGVITVWRESQDSA